MIMGFDFAFTEASSKLAFLERSDRGPQSLCVLHSELVICLVS